MRFSFAFFLIGVIFSVSADAQHGCDHSLGCDAGVGCDGLSACDSIGDCDGCLSTCDEGCFSSLMKGFAEEGILFSGDLVQVYQGISEGGLARHDKYGGLATYGAMIDFGKLGISQGTLLQITAQSQFGESINTDTGSLLIASNVNALFPEPGQQSTAITNFLLTQFLSERFALFAGRLDTFSGDQNAYASGRGKTQFLNGAFVFNPLAIRTVPYVTYGAGFSVLKDLEPVFSFSVIDPKDYAGESGLDELFSDGVTLSAEARRETHYFGRPGHVLLGGAWSNREVIDLNELARLPIDVSQPVPRAADSWFIYGNWDHRLWSYDCCGKKGWGAFGRWGYADDDTNPFDWYLAYGFGGDSPVPGRDNDTFGLGWYRAGITDQIPGLLLDQDPQGVEAFYSVALTDKVFLSPDVQWMKSSRNSIDESWILGLRLYMTL